MLSPQGYFPENKSSWRVATRHNAPKNFEKKFQGRLETAPPRRPSTPTTTPTPTSKTRVSATATTTKTTTVRRSFSWKLVKAGALWDLVIWTHCCCRESSQLLWLFFTLSSFERRNYCLTASFYIIIIVPYCNHDKKIIFDLPWSRCRLASQLLYQRTR